MAKSTTVTSAAGTRDSLEGLRIAIVHPFLISQGGGEKVIDALARMFPDAEFFALLLDRSSLSGQMQGRTIHTTALSRFPRLKRFYQHLSPLYDLAVRQFDLRGFDVVISSGGPGAKTIRVDPGCLHIHYCHSPVRYLWDQYEVWLKRLPVAMRPLFALSARRQRARDFAAAQRVDTFIANSNYIGARIRRYYQRDSITIYPPVVVDRPLSPAERGDYYLTVGRLVPGKRTDLLVEACNRLGRRLLVAGQGPEYEALKAAAGPTVEVLGRVDDAVLDDLYLNARAFLFAADEDFGIATVEAQSYGLPAIAYGHGGSLEILENGTDSVLFAEQTVDAVAAAIRDFEAREAEFRADGIRRRAQRFSEEVFIKGIRDVVLKR
ncbi:glycosyltransferase [Novosphingobium mangrovi (ex Huang et al. 2023)]|uniref:Glycosyltransferase n=1 Tax=Novosphingobium mangrovi (ex Huang et al. 2023) TaxID=2976432 RepID=A0ABT2I519_9SPHN|nr:glycosyltransferase [Novosphingobium mangrovi (ex Huang et al. 2023)]MCT2399905.1 glycosyltransferase [Novosphingobium mangrovi (ex Huang et al. 2023)]